MTDPNLDALIAAPQHHRLAFENETVRVLETKVMPGDTVPLHTHELSGSLYFLSWTDFIRRDANGEVMLDTAAAGVRFEPGQAVWSGPLGPHTLENVGDQPLHVIAVEIKPVN